jgi:glycosyltransferase involved in cell wall biosynthesis
MNNKKKAFVILTPGFAASDKDSTCLPMQQHFVHTLKALYPELNVIVLSFQYPYHSATYQWYDITVTAFNGKNKGGFARLLLRQKIYTALKNIKKQYDIAGLLSFWFGECAYVGKTFADKNGIRHYCWLLGQDARKENKYPKKIYLDKQELVALSDFLQDEFATNHHTRPATVIPPGNDIIEPIKPAPKREIDILAAGSLIAIKRFHIYLEVLAELKKHLPALKCRLVGDGPEKVQLQELSKTLGLEESLTITGELPNTELLGLMQQSKLFLHPSAYEGFSGVCLEALSMGMHVISFTQPMRHSIEQWDIVEATEDMIAKSIEVLTSPDSRYSKQTILRMEDTVKSFIELYK